MSLYYVTSAQTPGNLPSFNIYIQKSIDDGVTWATVYDGPIGIQNFDVLLISGVLHIFGDDLNGSGNMSVFRFDTATDLMLDAGTDLGFGFNINVGVKAARFATGKVLLAFNPGGATKTYLYDPALNTISAGVALDQSGGRKVYGAVVDPNTDKGFVFFDGSALGVPNEIDCVTVSNANVQQTSVFAFNASSSTGANQLPRNVGRPVISGGLIHIPYVFALSSVVGPVVGTLRIAHATPANSPVFSDDLVYTDAQPPYVWTLTNKDWFIPNAVDVSGTLYVLFQANINQDDDNTSQASLMYSTSTVPGAWSGAAVAFTGPAQSDGLSAYPLALSAGGIGVIACYANPVATFPLAGTLLVKYITLSSSSTVGLGQSIAFQGASGNNGPTNLLFQIGAGTCPIVINAGHSGSGPCANPGTNPSIDSYLELRKVLVAWKKETHLPIRGKS